MPPKSIPLSPSLQTIISQIQDSETHSQEIDFRAIKISEQEFLNFMTVLIGAIEQNENFKSLIISNCPAQYTDRFETLSALESLVVNGEETCQSAGTNTAEMLTRQQRPKSARDLRGGCHKSGELKTAREESFSSEDGDAAGGDSSENGFSSDEDEGSSPTVSAHSMMV